MRLYRGVQVNKGRRMNIYPCSFLKSTQIHHGQMNGSVKHGGGPVISWISASGLGIFQNCNNFEYRKSTITFL